MPTSEDSQKNRPVYELSSQNQSYPTALVVGLDTIMLGARQNTSGLGYGRTCHISRCGRRVSTRDAQLQEGLIWFSCVPFRTRDIFAPSL